MLTPATYLTLARLALLPAIALMFFFSAPWAVWTALGLYALASLTDFLDGWVARRFHQVSALGAMLDPAVDKIFIAALFILLCGFGRLEHAWVLPPILILTREFLVSGLREYLGPAVPMPVSRLAKWKTASQMASIAALIAAPVLPYAEVTGKLLLLGATVLTLKTGFDYLKAGLTKLNQT